MVITKHLIHTVKTIQDATLFLALCVIKTELLRQLNTTLVVDCNLKKNLLCQILPAKHWSHFWLAVAPGSACFLSGCTADPVFARHAADKRVPRKQWQKNKHMTTRSLYFGYCRNNNWF